jgi:excisionase family DNA binding protein
MRKSIKYRNKESDQALLEDAHRQLEEVLLTSTDGYLEFVLSSGNRKILIPISVVKEFMNVLKWRSMNKEVSIVEKEKEVSTQEAADLLGFSRPHMVKILEEGQMEYTKVGRHRRVKLEDVIKYKVAMKMEQKKLLVELMRADEADGLYSGS